MTPGFCTKNRLFCKNDQTYLFDFCSLMQSELNRRYFQLNKLRVKQFG